MTPTACLYFCGRSFKRASLTYAEVERGVPPRTLHSEGQWPYRPPRFRFLILNAITFEVGGKRMWVKLAEVLRNWLSRLFGFKPGGPL